MGLEGLLETIMLLYLMSTETKVTSEDNCDGGKTPDKFGTSSRISWGPVRVCIGYIDSAGKPKTTDTVSLEAIISLSDDLK